MPLVFARESKPDKATVLLVMPCVCVCVFQVESSVAMLPSPKASMHISICIIHISIWISKSTNDFRQNRFVRFSRVFVGVEHSQNSILACAFLSSTHHFDTNWSSWNEHEAEQEKKKNGWSPNENKHGEHSHARSDVNNSGCEMNRKAIHSIFIYIIYLSSFFIAPILAEGAGKHRSKTQSWIWIRAKRNKIRKTSNKLRPIMYLYGVLLGGVNKKRCRGFGGHLPVIIKCISNKSRTHSMNRWSDTAFRTHLPTRTILASSCRC